MYQCRVAIMQSTVLFNGIEPEGAERHVRCSGLTTKLFKPAAEIHVSRYRARKFWGLILLGNYLAIKKNLSVLNILTEDSNLLNLHHK